MLRTVSPSTRPAKSPINCELPATFRPATKALSDTIKHDVIGGSTRWATREQCFGEMKWSSQVFVNAGGATATLAARTCASGVMAGARNPTTSAIVLAQNRGFISTFLSILHGMRKPRRRSSRQRSSCQAYWQPQAAAARPPPSSVPTRLAARSRRGATRQALTSPPRGPRG